MGKELVTTIKININSNHQLDRVNVALFLRGLNKGWEVYNLYINRDTSNDNFP